VTATEKFEASSVAMKLIAGLLGLLIIIGTIATAQITSKLDKVDSIGDTLAVHRMQIQGLYEMKQDLREIKNEIRELNGK